MTSPPIPWTAISWTALSTAALVVFGFLAAMFVGAIVLPGIERSGYPLKSGGALPYKLTGMSLFFVAHIAVAVATFGFGVSLRPIVDLFWPIFVMANVAAFAITLGLYLWGRRAGPVEKGEVGHDLPLPALVRDLWFGNELNPRWLGVDIKMFMYQPSLIGVNLIVASFAYAQYEIYGTITPQMYCFVGFWWAYLFTHYVKEEFMLSTWDVIAENFGFMLVWGDLVYVPFLYSLPGWWILHDTTPMRPPLVVALCAFFLFSLWVFREANWQKERYKRDKTASIWGKPAEALGGRLLVSGFWGIGRKINYTGELGVYLSFAMCAGSSSVFPYLLPLSLLVLLGQRAARDDKKCRQKYGELWESYCKRARFRIIPFVY